MDIPTDPETYGYKVVKGDNGQPDDLIAHSLEVNNPSWNFKPSNPYDMVTGAIQVKEWVFVNYSNYNIRLFASLIVAGLILNWLVFILPKRSRRKG
jgi:hypothetical protein